MVITISIGAKRLKPCSVAVACDITSSPKWYLPQQETLQKESHSRHNLVPNPKQIRKKWYQDDQTALVLLQQSLDKSVLQSFIALDSAKSLWDALKRTYGNISNISRIFEIKKRIFQLQQNEEELNKRGEEDKVFAILLTLDASYNDLVYHLLRQSSLPQFDEATEAETSGDDQLASQVVEQSGKWFQEDQMILAILHCFMDHDVLSSYVHINTAKELWETLEGAYGNVSNLTRIYELKKSLHNIHQEDKLFVKHLGEFNTIRAELNELRPPSTYPKIVAERLEQDNIFALLSSLHHSYGDLVQHIIRQDKLPSFSEVCAMIKKEEGAKKLFKGTCEIAHYRKVNVSNKLNKHIVCEHCNKAGHTKNKCWILHPHLKPSRFMENAPHGNPTKESAMATSTSEFVTKADFNKLHNCSRSKKTQDTKTSHEIGRDERSKYTWITLMPSKSHVFETFKKFHKYVANHYDAKIKVFRTDNGENQRGKLDARSQKCILVGYSTTQKGYKCFDPIANRVRVSREVIFHEDLSYYDTQSWNTIEDLPTSQEDKFRSF
ncbi:PREDICTED: uncharacterized protein LOC104824676 [Tarenaya hassleriana]|uniref:uncharacterized protein LOC104824676 n=1 Tax=Tarenaya hassleriana TaxID=28532 RepID=UPI00053C33F7|nr:PREDICTED: uncharacterized protein LOC104824676 [Tarenaya hassleriana]